MTGSNHERRSLFLTALLVCSVVPGTVALVGDTAVATDATDVRFGRAVVEQERGDVADIPIVLANTDRATLQIRTATDDNYTLTVEVTDDSGDGRVTVEFNSYTAGTARGGRVVSVADSEDSINATVQGGQFTADNDQVGADVLAPGDYDLLLAEGHADGTTVGSEDAVGTLSLTGRSTDAARVWVAPAGREVGRSPAAVHSLIASDTLTRTDTVARGDTVIVEVEATGLEGVLAASPGNATDSYMAVAGSTTADAVVDSSAEPLFDASIEVADSGASVQGSGTSVSAFAVRNLSVVYDEANGTHFLVLDSDAVADRLGAVDGDSVVANFTMTDDSALSDDTVTVTDTFELVARDATLNGGNDVTLVARRGQTISGTTNLAPGSRVTVRVRSTTAGSRFRYAPEAIVRPDGTFAVTLDLRNRSRGATVAAQTVLGGTAVGDAIDGTVVAPEPATAAISAQRSNGSTVTVDGVTTFEGGFVAIHRGSATGAVVGVSDYLQPGSHVNVDVPLDARQTANFTAVAVPHRDTDGDQRFEFDGGSLDRPYATAGTEATPVTVVADPTPTASATPTSTALPEPTDGGIPTPEATTPPGGSGPGFTATIALVALGVAVLVLRDDG